MPERFYLSFHNGLCRISHGDTRDEAIADALQTAAGTGMTSNVLDKDYRVLGTVHQRDGAFTFEKANHG